MRQTSRIAIAAILSTTTHLAAQEANQEGAYRQRGIDSPAQHHVETFLSQAAGWYEQDRQSFEDFCRKFSIDPNWPSAELLAAADGPFQAEYLARVNEYAVSPTGLDPNDWRPTEVGLIIGELYLQFRADGLPWDLEAFLLFIETEMGPTFTRFGDRPFDALESAHREDLFWQGLAATGSEAEELVRGRREE